MGRLYDTIAAVDADGDLYRRWVAGERGAGGELIGRYFEAIGRFLATKVYDPDDVQDLISQTFEVCAKSLGRFEERSSFRTYLFGIANNVARDHIKKKHRRPQDVDFHVTRLADLGPTPSLILGGEKEQQLLLAALRSIPYQLQVLIELSYFEEMTRHQIAEVLDIPPGTVASQLRRAKKSLFEELEKLAACPDLLESTLHGLRDWAADIRDQFDAAAEDE
jgi:RNA polymerase sigma-70 factor (ECF subfamily)